MKFLALFVAIFAIAFAADEQQQQKLAEKAGEKQNDRRQGGLEWPLPDWRNEGDLILQAVHFYTRVGELRKQKSENEFDKMILSYGREFLRRAHAYLTKTPDFKILPILCRDSRNLNSTKRWEIRVQPELQQQVNGEQEKKVEGDAAVPPTQEIDSTKPKSNVSHENITSFVQPQQSYQVRLENFYDHMGDNFARLLLRKYQKQTLTTEETEYMERFLNEEAVHFGVMGIYCHQGENVANIVKELASYIDEKQQ